MTADERDLTPEEEAELSRLLADAGGPVPTPPEVVARLDDVLAGLVEERAADPIDSSDPTVPAVRAVPGGPVSLDAERRRRRWPKVLLAAAAVAAGGYGLGAALTGTTMSGDGDSALSADESAAGGSTSGGSDAGGAEDGQAMESAPGGGAAGRLLTEAPANASALRGGAPRIRSDRLAEDVVRVLGEAEDEVAGDDATNPEDTLLRGATACIPSRLGPRDTWYLVRYDARRAALVTTPPEGGTVRAVVVGCAGERLAAVTVPTR